MKHEVRITKENVEKLKELYSDYREVMLVEAKRILKEHSLAEDAVHQAFLKIIDKLEKFKDEDADITVGFLIIVVRNVAIDMYKSRKKSSSKLEYIENIYNENSDMFSSFKTPCDEVISKESKENILKAVNKLPAIYSDVLLLEILYECPQKEIAKLLNISYSATKKRIERARKLLTEELRKEELV